MTYVPLWCKSSYSFLEGASHPDELAEACRDHGIAAFALTDRDGLYGAVRAHMACRRLGIRLIIGSQITVDDGSHILLLPQDREGYAGLCGLVSKGRLRSPKGESTVSWREVCESHHGLLAIALRRGLLSRQNGWEGALADLADAFGDRLYVGLPRHRTAGEGEIERRLVRRAERFAVAQVAAPEVLYHDKSRRRLQDVLTCIRHNTTLEEAGTLLLANDEHELASGGQMRLLYADRPDLVERTGEVADRCRFSLDEIRYRYPSEDLPDGQTSSQWLRRLCFQGAGKRYGGAIPPDVKRQLDRELDLIDELDYCGYFLTMYEIVRYCRSRGILCQGRGSAANSAVCYCLGITAVDPVRMDLLFERFISRERAEPPDIDLDISHRRREEVIQHVYEKYGRDRAAMVANFIRYRFRSAVRDVGKALGIPSTSLDRLAKLIFYTDKDLTPVLEEAGLDPAGPKNRLLLELVREIQDFPRHLSIHPGGFLLGSEAVTRLVPVENATMPGRTVIQWDKYDVEDMNLFKVDLLGLGALTHLDYCFRLIREHRGERYSMTTIPPEDPGVFEMASRADTVGVFQIESRAQMSMLPRLRPRCFYDLVIEVSIVRPGPIVGGMVHPYLRRRKGEEAVIYPHPDLEPVLRKTLGVPLFQEQVMRLAMVAADYTPGEADQLRRDMAAWHRSGRIEKHREKIIGRMTAKGIQEGFAEKVFDQIRGFGEYGFPESHAASFALIGYCTAWLKLYYPAEFTCALLNAWPMGFYSPSTIVEDAKRHGIRVLPIDVLRSSWECTLEEAARAARRGRAAPPEPGDAQRGSRFAIRLGLRFVKGLGEADWEKIRTARRRGAGRRGAGTRASAALKSFAAASRLDGGALAVLAESGAFCCFGVERREALWQVLGIRGGKVQSHLRLEDRERAPAFAPLDALDGVAWDYVSTGLSAETHPLEPFREELMRLGLPDARSLAERPDGMRVSYVGLVICRQRPATANGVTFMTLEDETGFVNLVVWSREFQRYRTLILTSALLGVSGKLQSQEGVVHLVVESCWKPRLSSRPAAAGSRDFR